MKRSGHRERRGARASLLPALIVAAAGCGLDAAEEPGSTRTADVPEAANATDVGTRFPHEASPVAEVGFLAAARLPEGIDAALIEKGARIFHGPGNCHICHAPDGKGARGVGADLTDDEWWHGDGSWPEIIRTIRSGVRLEVVRNGWGAVMPPRGGTGISAADVRAVAAYVWSLRLAPDG